MVTSDNVEIVLEGGGSETPAVPVPGAGETSDSVISDGIDRVFSEYGKPTEEAPRPVQVRAPVESAAEGDEGVEVPSVSSANSEGVPGVRIPERIRASLAEMNPPEGDISEGDGATSVVSPDGSSASDDLLRGAPEEVVRDPGQKLTWKKIKQHEKQLETQLRQAQEENKTLAEYKTQAAKAAEQALELQKRLEDTESRLGKLDLSQSREFQERYDKPLQGLYSRSMRLLERVVKSPDEAKAVLSKVFNPALSQEDQQEALQDLPVAVQAALVQNALEVQDALSARTTALEDWKNTRSLVNVQGGQRSVIEAAREVHEAISKAVPVLVSEGSWFFTEDPEDQSWNDQRNNMIGAAKVVLKEGKPEEVAKLVLSGMAAEKYRLWGESEHREALKLRAELKRRLGAAPGLGGGRNVAPITDAPKEKPKAINPENWLEANLGAN